MAVHVWNSHVMRCVFQVYSFCAHRCLSPLRLTFLWIVAASDVMVSSVVHWIFVARSSTSDELGLMHSPAWYSTVPLQGIDLFGWIPVRIALLFVCVFSCSRSGWHFCVPILPFASNVSALLAFFYSTLCCHCGTVHAIACVFVVFSILCLVTRLFWDHINEGIEIALHRRWECLYCIKWSLLP